MALPAKQMQTARERYLLTVDDALMKLIEAHQLAVRLSLSADDDARVEAIHGILREAWSEMVLALNSERREGRQ